jgi:hypothetical protein
MIFDESDQPPLPARSAEPFRRRRRRRSSSVSESSGRRRRGNGSSSFSEAVRFDDLPSFRSDGNAKSWLWVLALLVLGTLGFAWFLQMDRSTPRLLEGEAPSTKLLPLIDPILAPLETGLTGYSTGYLAELQSSFHTNQEKTGLADREAYATAATLAQILEEAAEDRARHIERLVKLGSPVEGAVPDLPTRTDLSEAERRQFELAVGISWQRNSGTYRNRVEELWYRLLRLEQGRFNLRSGPQSMMPELSVETRHRE